MRVIRSKADLEELKEDRSLVSVYVDHGYSVENIELVLRMKRAFDAHVADAWHMLIPCSEGYRVDSWIDADAFGYQLNRQLAREYQVRENHLPALVFEFDPDKEYFYVALGQKTEDKRTEMIRHIATMAVEEQEKGSKDAIEFRGRLHQNIAIYARQQKALTIISKTSSRLADLIGLGANLKGLIDNH
ncbi:hypothetical protein ACTJK5_12555 [Agrobacterium sp. 22094]|uniref:hypothetical protein n=1 Tax=Agrobacterium sp. 22094 TaxID=3453872 RepID=UPI003F845101